ncbi:MAG TPA: hypothetical protein VLI69_01775 [Gammaproteobacteria bacterium]|nr:hypothetical protein [Gammaproteobacteria bacterium]
MFSRLHRKFSTFLGPLDKLKKLCQGDYANSEFQDLIKKNAIAAINDKVGYHTIIRTLGSMKNYEQAIDQIAAGVPSNPSPALLQFVNAHSTSKNFDPNHQYNRKP